MRLFVTCWRKVALTGFLIAVAGACIHIFVIPLDVWLQGRHFDPVDISEVEIYPNIDSYEHRAKHASVSGGVVLGALRSADFTRFRGYTKVLVPAVVKLRQGGARRIDVDPMNCIYYVDGESGHFCIKKDEAEEFSREYRSLMNALARSGSEK